MLQRLVFKSTYAPLMSGSALLGDSSHALLAFLFLFYTANFCSCRLDEELREASEAAK